MTFAFDSRPDGNNPEGFLAMRTLFGIGWLVVALVFATDASGRRDATSEKPVQPARSGPTSGP